jgi:predicted HicB family RNase H-like nuclease
MKPQTISLDRIVDNPFRDMKLFPINTDQVAIIQDSIADNGFFGGVKARARNGKIELACGHHRIAAAREAKLGKIDIVVDDMDDDEMIRLMVTENATQSGTNPGAIMNEVAAVTRRLIGVLLDQPKDLVRIHTKWFEGQKGFESARGRLLARLDDPDKDGGIGWRIVQRYLANGNEKSPRSYSEIQQAISALKQSGKYDRIVDDELRKHPQPVTGKPAKGKTIVKAKQPTKPKRRVLDENCAHVFPNDYQFRAFREAVTTEGAQAVIPVEKQLALAKEIMAGKKDQFSMKQAGAPFIKKYVQGKVLEGLKEQREINKEERDRYNTEQREARIDDELHSANASLRSLISAIGKMMDLAKEFPAHPKLGGFSARLDTLVGAIKQFSAKLK